jgi:hypothetical protein
MVSVSPGGHPVFFIPDQGFFEFSKGVAHKYYDPSLGLLTYKGRDYIRTDATSFVRDGTEFTVYLPGEHKFLRRPALANDSAFFEHDFAAEGIWSVPHRADEVLFGHTETVARSITLAGEEILTRRNGEILVRRGDVIEPYFISEGLSQSELVRLDVEVPREGGPRAMTLFFEPKSTDGARQWLKHFRDAQAAVQKISLQGSPFIRNYNTVFYNGEEDLRACVATLRQVVDDLNGMYTSDLDSSNLGRLWEPTAENISSSMLNQLHFEFENFGERFKKGSYEEQRAIADAYGPFCKLNDCIHATEGALANRHRSMEEAWWALHCSFLPDFYQPLTDQMYGEFSLDWDFGTMYMGYHTLGKDILAAFWNDDMDLFRRDEIRPQRISSSEIFVFLGPKSIGQMNDLRRWWCENDLNQFGYRLGDPRNSIGYIPVASLISHGKTEIEIKTAIKGCKGILGSTISFS